MIFSPALQRWERIKTGIEAREAGDRKVRGNLSPASRAWSLLGTLFPAINRWAILVRPLHGLECISALGTPWVSSLANGFCNCYYFRSFCTHQ